MPPCRARVDARADAGTRATFTPVDTRRRSVGEWLLLNLLVVVAYSALGAVIVLFGIIGVQLNGMRRDSAALKMWMPHCGQNRRCMRLPLSAVLA